jgi:peptidoglycan/LPS O-acetylase OafA/YrhL
VMLHVPMMFRGLVCARGYLAVDFFFMLSGFVLAFAYQRKLDTGLTTFAFLRIRVMRLYPLFLLGCVLGCLSIFGLPAPPAGGRQRLLLNLLMLPAILPLAGPARNLYPFDIPEWSIFYELLANVVHALVLRRRDNTFLAAVLGTFGLLLVLSVRKTGGLNFGAQQDVLPQALCRVLFSYLMGMALYRIWASRRWEFAVPAWLPLALLLLALSLPLGSHPGAGDTLVTLFVFPVILLLGAGARASSRLTPFCEWLGTASYAIYVLHFPIAGDFFRAWGHLRGQPATLDGPWSGICFLLFMLGFALLVDRIYDIPVRRMLRSRFAG